MSSLMVHPGSALNGAAAVPGDKSISHRAALFAGLAQGESVIENFLQSGVTRAMLNALSGLGIAWSWQDARLVVQGQGLPAWHSPTDALNCGNSATTLRLLAGAVAAAGVAARLDGSDGLRRRPMGRIVAPLRQLGVSIQAAEGDCAPLELAERPHFQRLKAARLLLPVASAQVKSCLLLAGLAAEGPVGIIEPSQSRDHSERMLRAMGVPLSAGPAAAGGWAVCVTPPEEPLRPLHMAIPGDFSAAAFLIVAALITPESQLTLQGVNLNPTRTGLLETLLEMGADIQVDRRREQAGEPVGDLTVRSSRLSAGAVSGARVVDMIDEFPIFAVAAAYAHGVTRVSGAEELRYKESDRIHSLCQELLAQGVDIREAQDGFTIQGSGRVPGSRTAQTHGDHRLAMALAVCGLASQAPICVAGSEIVAESFPGFGAELRRLGADLEVQDGG